MDKLSYQQGKQDAIVFIERCDAVRSSVKIQRANLNKAKCPKGKHWVQPSNGKRGFCRSGGDGSGSLHLENTYQVKEIPIPQFNDRNIVPKHFKGGDVDSTELSQYEDDFMNHSYKGYGETNLTRREVHDLILKDYMYSDDIEGYTPYLEQTLGRTTSKGRKKLPKEIQKLYGDKEKWKQKYAEAEKERIAYNKTPAGKRNKIMGYLLMGGLATIPILTLGAVAKEQIDAHKKDSYKQGRLDAIASLNIRLDDGYIPPEKVRSEAKKGLEARRNASKSNRGGLSVQQANNEGVGSGVQRAVNLVNSDRISLDTIKKMRSFFARHRNNYEKAKSKGLKPEESKAIQAWLLWGGDAGERWAIEVLGKNN